MIKFGNKSVVWKSGYWEKSMAIQTSCAKGGASYIWKCVKYRYANFTCWDVKLVEKVL